jgi:hypothetical protein
MLANRVSFKLWAEASFQARPAMRTESFCMRRKANENRVSSIAATIETGWLPLSTIGPLRLKHKIRAWNTSSSCTRPSIGKSALASPTSARPSAYLNGGPCWALLLPRAGAEEG